jgi:hypothetical protein
MHIEAELGPLPRHDRRWFERSPAEIAAAFRERGRTRLPVQLIDLSPKGCKVKLTGDVVVGSHAWILLPTLESWYARVAWSEAGEAGLDFERPLHAAVTNMIIARAGAAGAGQARPRC